MPKKITLTLTPEIAYNPSELRRVALRTIGENPDTNEGLKVRLLKRSIDSRQAIIKVNLEAEIGNVEELGSPIHYTKPTKPLPSHAKRILIVGTGPAGLFAALRLVELGLKPILIERGKDVRARRFDLVKVNQKGGIDADSNYCFGEGGAGTFSDGKLYTRSTKRGDFRRVLEIFHAHGAREDVLIDTHPHIGTNLLPAIISKIRETLEAVGAEFHFSTRVVDFEFEGALSPSRIKGVLTQYGDRIQAEAVILATGHSARDIYRLLQRRGVRIEAKPFALGVRVEHAQQWLDSVQYRQPERGPHLPASSYRLVAQIKHEGVERGVFSFCMCPGGFIVPAATALGEIVVNGMSPSRRDSPYANSG
ncbi:MAG: FAD-dependent protein, partial [Bdellovibrionota bacterium]